MPDPSLSNLTKICSAALKQGASDVHLKVDRPPLIRVDGELRPLAGGPALSGGAIAKMAWSIMSPSQREHFKAKRELDLGWDMDGKGRFRVNIFRQQQAVGIVMRAISAKIKSIAELGLPPILEDLCSAPRGLILVTGATGSGKTTTLAAMIEQINRTRHKHVITIEDPIEYVFTDRLCAINQREVGIDSPSFASALRAALRQDPDIILVGELRDRETVEIAMQAAETGHLVLATLHTINATETLTRLMGLFEPHHRSQIQAQLVGSLIAVLSMRLLPKKSGGLVAALEILRNVGAITECLRDRSRLHEIPDHMHRGGATYGMQTFEIAVHDLVVAGVVDPETALDFVEDPDAFQLRLSGIVHTG